MALPNLSQIQQELDKMLPKLKPIDLPTGTFCHFHSVPDGWLECNGAAISRTTYAELFKVIGTTYGSGDGSTTFNLPDMNGRVLQATTNHSEVGQMKEASLPNISGTTITGGVLLEKNTTNLGSGALKLNATTAYRPEGNFKDSLAAQLSFTANKSNSIYSGSRVQTPAGLVLLCVKF